MRNMKLEDILYKKFIKYEDTGVEPKTVKLHPNTWEKVELQLMEENSYIPSIYLFGMEVKTDENINEGKFLIE